jgi:hypothetical protein
LTVKKQRKSLKIERLREQMESYEKEVSMVNLKIQQELKAVLEEEDQKLGIKTIFDKLREIMAVED